MYQNAKDELHGRQEKKVTNNTFLRVMNPAGEEYISMYLHGNRVATFTKGYIQLYSAGWQTTTTKNRLNMALGIARIHTVSVYQHNWQWYLGYYEPKTDTKFFDGIKVNYNGNIIS